MERFKCIYNVDKDGLDVQSIHIEYESGAIVNFMLNFNAMGPRSSRNFHAVGHRGRIWGNLHEKKVYLYENLTDEVTSFETAGDGSGHGGGDRIHALTLRRMMSEPAFRPEQDAYAGYLSAVMCFAADLSCAERRRIAFRYRSDGVVDFS